ncbi:MAG: hypothetical protein M0006_05655 [Magnetospirillum sp.]|nr:hypothetical protein [Magnetospirillum sp.]
MARRRSRRGQQSWLLSFKLLKLALFLATIGAAAFYAYEVGQKLALDEVGGLRRQIDDLTAAETGRKEAITRLSAQLDETKKRADDYQAKYQQLAPSSDVEDILTLVRGKLASGLDAKRLAFVIQQAEPPRHCGDAATKRFMVKTAKFSGSSTWVRFADLITITANGIGANAGNEQWYDPDMPVAVTFTAIGGKESRIEGKLPLQHSMVVKNGEYRFTIAPGARGFVEVTGDRCDYKG